jgi:PIN domain nuclease of toxin-antitoxin system
VKLLLDTCTFLWICADDSALSQRAAESFRDTDNDVYLSAVSSWEIAVKHAIGKLPLPSPPARFIPEQRTAHGIEPLALHEDAALHLVLLPAIHKDPFDRMLVCQAMVDGLVILTPDEQISRYPVRTFW